MKLADLARASTDVAATSSRLAKIARLADALSQCAPDEIAIAVGFLTGWPRQGKLGVGWAAVASARNQPPSTEATLGLHDVDALFAVLPSVTGKGSAGERKRMVDELFRRATLSEQLFLSALLIGEVRQGALEGVLMDAVAKAADVPADQLRRAAMIAGDLGAVAQRLFGADDRPGVLASYGLQLFRPVQPMLADSAEDVAHALKECGGRAVIEWKLDGARIQVHRDGDR